MKIFACHRINDKSKADKVINQLIKKSNNTVAVLREYEHDENWKSSVENKLKEVDFVIFLLGADTFKSDQIKWEYTKAKELNKRIIGIELSSVTEESILFCQGFQVFKSADQCLDFLKEIFEHDRQLRIEQYKIMVGSTEKVTEQRLRVNNIFFTITSSLLSIAFVLGKAFEFSIPGIVGTFVLTLMAFLVTFFWAKLIKSYGTLNTGKFQIIDKIEKQLRTNMFEDEWVVLQAIGYEPNSKTEITVIKRFRLFIIFISVMELIYLVFKLYNQVPKCDY